MIMPKFGNIHAPNCEVVRDINVIADMGFDFVELNFVEPHGMPDVYRKKSGKIKAALRKRKMFAYAHAPPWADLGSINELVRFAWTEYSKKLVDISKTMGVKKLNFHAYTAGIHKVHNSKELIMKKHIQKNLVDSFQDIASHARKKKISILYENWMENFRDYTTILNSARGIEANIDTSHAFVVGKMPEVRKFLSLGKKIEHMHFSDNRGKHDDHLQIGKGRIDYASIISVLKKINYDKTITLEIFEGGRKSPKKSLKFVKDQWVRA